LDLNQRPPGRGTETAPGGHVPNATQRTLDNFLDGGILVLIRIVSIRNKTLSPISRLGVKWVHYGVMEVQSRGGEM